MTKEPKREYFETKAKEAEEDAAKAKNDPARDRLLKVAEAYRQLAKSKSP